MLASFEMGLNRVSLNEERFVGMKIVKLTQTRFQNMKLTFVHHGIVYI
jgi:hypothetical protein